MCYIRVLGRGRRGKPVFYSTLLIPTISCRGGERRFCSKHDLAYFSSRLYRLLYPVKSIFISYRTFSATWCRSPWEIPSASELVHLRFRGVPAYFKHETCAFALCSATAGSPSHYGKVVSAHQNGVVFSFGRSLINFSDEFL